MMKATRRKAALQEHEAIAAVGWLSGLVALTIAIAVLAIAVAWPGLLAINYAAVALTGALLALVLQIGTAIIGRHELSTRGALIAQATASQLQTDELFVMTEMLQSADSYEDATAVLTATSLRLLPELGGALYIFNNSRDRLDLTGDWNLPAMLRARRDAGAEQLLGAQARQAPCQRSRERHACAAGIMPRARWARWKSR